MKNKQKIEMWELLQIYLCKTQWEIHEQMLGDIEHSKDKNKVPKDSNKMKELFPGLLF